LHLLGNTKVDHLDGQRIILRRHNEDIPWLEIAMHNALAMRVVERACDLSCDMQCLMRSETPASLMENLLESPSIEKWHQDTPPTANHSDSINWHDVAMMQLRYRYRLALEPIAQERPSAFGALASRWRGGWIGLLEELGGDHLEHLAKGWQLLVPAQVHRAHAALSEQALDDVVVKHRPEQGIVCVLVLVCHWFTMLTASGLSEI
jgi:hypothetical protein